MNPWVEWGVALLIVGGVSISTALLSRPGERRRGIAFAAAWMVPGAGHVLMGKWRKGLFFFGILAAVWLAGMSLVGFRPVSFEDNPFYYVGQYGSGLLMILSRGISSEKAVPRPDDPGGFDPGLLYVCSVGLLNLVIALNVLDSRRIAAGSPRDGPEAPGEGPGSTKGKETA